MYNDKLHIWNLDFFKLIHAFNDKTGFIYLFIYFKQ